MMFFQDNQCVCPCEVGRVRLSAYPLCSGWQRPTIIRVAQSLRLPAREPLAMRTVVRSFRLLPRVAGAARGAETRPNSILILADELGHERPRLLWPDQEPVAGSRPGGKAGSGFGATTRSPGSPTRASSIAPGGCGTRGTGCGRPTRTAIFRCPAAARSGRRATACGGATRTGRPRPSPTASVTKLRSAKSGPVISQPRW